MGCLIVHLIWSLTLFVTNADYMYFFYYWTLWGWWVSIVTQILTLLAAHNPEYWHVTAFAWLQACQGLNFGVTAGFWGVLTPLIFMYWPKPDPEHPSVWTWESYFMIVHMTILHATPIIMTTVNIYFSDIKILRADWKLVTWHGFFYMFANWLGAFDMGHEVYPLITWKSYPVTIGIFLIGIAVMSGFYLCFTSWTDAHLKRRGEK